jgi:hypothetical protein
MRAQAHPTAWGTQLGISRTGQYRRLRAWWAARTAARREARLASLGRRWDGTREAVSPIRAEAAIDMAVARGTLSIAIQPYALA